MSQVILNILCEGQTEDRFANQVLKQYLSSYKIVVKTTILLTSKKKNIRGGILSYQQAKRDLELLIKQYSKKTFEKHYYTTMFDLYALPDDFPEYTEANKIQDCYGKVKKLEEKFAEDIACQAFIPYIQLHEFEALVFCGLEHLLVDYPDMTKQISNLQRVVGMYDDNTEKINNSLQTAPSKRIIKEFEKFHNYDKPKSGVLVTSKVGVEELKNKCLHFKEWIETLEKLSIEKT